MSHGVTSLLPHRDEFHVESFVPKVNSFMHRFPVWRCDLCAHFEVVHLATLGVVTAWHLAMFGDAACVRARSPVNL